MSNVVKKVGGAIGLGKKKPTPVMDMAATAAGTSVEEMVGGLQQTEAQKKAAIARKRSRTGRGGRRSLLAAGRLGGGGQGQDQQDTLGAA